MPSQGSQSNNQVSRINMSSSFWYSTTWHKTSQVRFFLQNRELLLKLHVFISNNFFSVTSLLGLIRLVRVLLSRDRGQGSIFREKGVHKTKIQINGPFK